MAENKTTNPQDNIKLLQSYKGEKYASLMQQISREKSRAVVLKESIKAKMAQLRELALEKERAEAVAEEAEVKPEVKEVKAEEPKVEVVEAPKAEEKPVEVAEPKKAEPVVEKPAPEVKPVKAEKVNKPVEKKEEKPAEGKKDGKPAQPKKQSSQPAEIERIATGKPNVWLIKYSDGTQCCLFPPTQERLTICVAMAKCTH